MSNVLYECPKCNARLFAAPSHDGKGGKSKIKCPTHDTPYEQSEDYVGPNFEYVDPAKGKSSRTQTHVQTGGVEHISTVHKVPTKANPTDEELLAFYRDRYRALFNEEADKRWRTARLRTLVMAEETRLDDATKAEFEARKATGEEEE